MMVTQVYCKVLQSIAYIYAARSFIDGSTGYSHSPDDDVLKHLALTYAKNHDQMGEAPCASDVDGKLFPDGITNGADWYPVLGDIEKKHV